MTSTVRIGFHEEATPTATVAAFPQALYGREFISGSPRLPQDLRGKLDILCSPWEAVGGGAYVSVKLGPADVASGAWTAYLKQAGTWLQDHPKNALIVHHEPEDDLDGATFLKMFTRARNEIKAGWFGARVVYAGMSYQWRPNGGLAYADPGFAQVVADEYLLSVYSGKTFLPCPIAPDHPGYLGWYQKVIAPKLAKGPVVYGFAERGLQHPDTAVLVSTIEAEAAWLASQVQAYDGVDHTKQPPSVYLGWSTPGTENDPRWVWNSAARAAFPKVIKALATPRTAPAPQPAPVPQNSWTDADLAAKYDQGFTAGKAEGLKALDAAVAAARSEGRAAGLNEGARSAYADVAAFATRQSGA